MKISLGVIAYNEERYLPELLDCISRQTYPHDKIEVILVDGRSSDLTLDIMEDYQSVATDFAAVKVLINEKRTQPCGWNVVINNMTGDALIRVDAHALIPEDFVENNVKCLESGEDVCGGPRTNIIDEETDWKQTLLTAEQSLFGSGIAPYRRGTEEKKYVDSAFHTCYRGEVIEKVGLFNEKLLRTEDNEYHYRVREAGYKICYDENIRSSYQTRNSLKKMAKQKFGNGLWIGKTALITPKCLSLYHFVPGALVASLIGAGFLSLFKIKWPLRLIAGAYALATTLLTALCLVKDKWLKTDLALLGIFPILHISYGVGTLKGLAEGLKDKLTGCE